MLFIYKMGYRFIYLDILLRKFSQSESDFLIHLMWNIPFRHRSHVLWLLNSPICSVSQVYLVHNLIQYGRDACTVINEPRMKFYA